MNLIERLEAATGADRELDLAIHVAVYPESEIANLTSKHRRGFDGKPGIAWDFWGAGHIICYQSHNLGGDCTSNGGCPMPHYTGSIDAALTLVPDNWTRCVDATAPECMIDVDLFAPGVRGKTVRCAHFSEPIATCIAALRARATVQS